MFKAVMFDLDGTTADTLVDLTNAMNAMLVYYGYPQRSREEISSFLGFGQRHFVTYSLPEYARNEENIDRCNAYYDAYYAEHTVVFTRAFDGIPEVFEDLKKRGVKTVIFSNKNQDHVDKIVSKIFDPSMIDIVMGAGKIKRKPDPEGVLLIAEKLGLSPSECAFVGDTEIDIMTAKNSHSFAVGVSWGFRERHVLCDCGADAVADSVKELAEILGV